MFREYPVEIQQYLTIVVQHLSMFVDILLQKTHATTDVSSCYTYVAAFTIRVGFGAAMRFTTQLQFRGVCICFTYEILQDTVEESKRYFRNEDGILID